jgi:sulfoxide reductase heme-binding subunit YedZ
VSRAAWITRVVKPALYVAGASPLLWIGFALATDRVDGDQVKFIQHVTGTTVLVSLFITLSVTPLRRLSGVNELIKLRRLCGLTAFWYALVHLFSYLVFDQALSPADIAEDIAEHPWVLVGFTTFLLLVPLAVTSTQGWVRRLGGKRWQRLHRLIYPAAIGGVLHYLWLVKKDLRDPLYFAVALGVILAARVWVSRRGGSPALRKREGSLRIASGASGFAAPGNDVV